VSKYLILLKNYFRHAIISIFLLSNVTYASAEVNLDNYIELSPKLSVRPVKAEDLKEVELLAVEGNPKAQLILITLASVNSSSRLCTAPHKNYITHLLANPEYAEPTLQLIYTVATLRGNSVEINECLDIMQASYGQQPRVLIGQYITLLQCFSGNGEASVGLFKQLSVNEVDLKPNLKEIYGICLAGSEIEKVKNLGLELIKKSAETGSEGSLAYLSSLIDRGNAKEKQFALEIIQEAVKNKSSTATVLYSLYLINHKDKKTEGISYLEAESKKGNIKADEFLCFYYLTDPSLKNINKAKYHANRAYPREKTEVSDLQLLKENNNTYLEIKYNDNSKKIIFY